MKNEFLMIIDVMMKKERVWTDIWQRLRTNFFPNDR